VLFAEPMPADFDARRDALGRTYCYRVLARRSRGVFARGRALWWPREADRDALDACAQLLVGSHDFTAFTPTETEHARFERTVLRAHWSTGAPRQLDGEQGEQGELLEFWIEAASFMRHMNRVLVGTMLEVAAGRRTLDEFGALLEGRPREQAGPTAPAHGLALASVSYGR
jgi:tRNA pseudouridine38-40 synthase